MKSLGLFFAGSWMCLVVSAQPTITSYSPQTGAVGTSVNISGTNFSTTLSSNIVQFNGTAATVTASTATSLTTSVPAGATSGKVTVTVGGQTATGSGNFIVLPAITGFNPTSGTTGTSVVITGTSFDPTPSNNTVKFNGTLAAVTAAGTTSLTTSVPSGATTGLVTVTIGGQTATSTANFTVDNTAPVVASNSTSGSIAPNADLPVSANFTDAETSIASAKVLYRPVAGVAPNNFISANMTATAGATFTATIPAAAISELGVEYKFLITNGAGLDNAASQTLYKTLIHYSGGLTITSYPGSAAGKESNNYRIIAIPLLLVSKTANDVFNNVLGGYDPTSWRMFRYNGSAYSELNANSALLPGEGYWFICVSSSPLNTGPGTTVDVDTASPFTITLNPGWNQIGNPYNFNISWADVIAANPSETLNLGGNSSKIRTFRGTIENVDVLKSLEGGFVKYLGSTTGAIKIPVSKNASIQGRMTFEDIAGTSPDQPAWEVLLNLKNGNVEYNLGGFGMHPEAKEGFDYHDDFNAPRFMDYLEVKFPKEYLGMTYTKDVVTTAENHVWDFTVESNLKDEIAFLSWDNTHFGGSKELYLLDVNLHKVTHMNSENRYEFRRHVSGTFKVIFGNPEFVKQELIPDRIVLYDPYPNPFAMDISIGFTLPQEVTVSGAQIEILNSMGAHVAGTEIFQPGTGHWLWNSGDQGSGLYVVRLKAGNQSMSRKIIKR